MSTHSPSNRAALRTSVVLFLAAVVLTLCLPDIRRVWQPVGNFGYLADADGAITAVDPHSPADRAGLKVGDRLDMASTNREYRYFVVNAQTNVAGQGVIVTVKHGASERPIVMVSEPEAMDFATKALIVSREFALLLFLGLGAALVLLRPSIATWAFYVFCLGFNGAPSIVISLLLFSTPLWSIGTTVVSFAFFQAGFVGGAVFAAFFLHEGSGGWRRWVYRLAPFALLILVGLNAYVILATSWFGWPAQGATDVLLFLQGALALVALYAFVETYVLSKGSDRQRIRWVILGFAISLAAFMAYSIIQSYNLPYWLYAGLNLIGVVVPITVAYAVIRHRVIDVSFVVSRALVFGLLTTLLVGAFALIDWFFIDKLKLARLGTIAEMGVAVAGGFWFNGLHKRVDSFVDATFFRQRHKAEVQLAKVAAALPLSPTTSAVGHFLVSEPVQAMSLASAAIFKRTRDGVYVREESEGWSTSDLARLGDEDVTLLTLAQAEGGPLLLYDHRWHTEGLPAGPTRPVLALPIIVRRELVAIVFYGSHIHGEALDPDELKAIASLAPGAAAAYDHLDAEAMKRKVDSLITVNESLRTQLAEAQIQPA